MKYEARFGSKVLSVEENLVDRAIRYLDPARANKRVAARFSAAVAGGYVGASTSRRQTLSWVAQKGDADAVIVSDCRLCRRSGTCFGTSRLRWGGKHRCYERRGNRPDA
jgi:hypothetical protein